MKGIILAGGAGSRLYPITNIASKQLQPVYDKPMIYYPLSTLMLAGIRDILIISTPEDIPKFQSLLKDGSRLGIKLSYTIQDKPNGIAQAFIAGEEFIANDQVTLILGDNLFYGDYDFIRNAIRDNTGATIFGYYVKNPEAYGVIEFGVKGNVLGIEEKPIKPKSNYAVPGLYIYNNNVIEIAKNLIPSARGELEITDVNKVYLGENKLKVKIIRRGVAWLDTGTPESLLEAAHFVATIEKRQGLKFGCLEEVAFRGGFIDIEQFEMVVSDLPNCSYRQYLQQIVVEKKQFELLG